MRLRKAFMWSSQPRKAASMAEERRKIPGYPDRFEISESGVLYRNGVPDKAACKVGGYPVVTITLHGGKRKLVYRHKLVCLAFHGLPPSSDHEVAHRDGVRDHIHKSNLRWATKIENADDRRRHSTHPSGEKNPRAVLDAAAIAELRATLIVAPGRKRLRRGAGLVAAAAKKYGVTKETILNAARGRTWAAQPEERK